MTLQVPFDQFPKTAERILGEKLAFLAPHGRGAMVTAAKSGTVVVAVTEEPPEDVAARLKEAGFETHDGAWIPDAPVDAEPGQYVDAYVGAVAYESSEGKPGLWLDAYEALPTEVQVLKAMFEDFRSTGQLDEVSFEEFVRLANPNVVIVSPKDLRSFVDQKG